MNRQKIKRWAPLILLIVIGIAVYLSGFHEFLTLENVQNSKQDLLNWQAQNPFLTAVGFVLIYTAFVALSLPAAALLTMIGGFLFGTTLGTLLVVIAATIGATIIFSIARSTVGYSLRERAGKLYNRIETGMNRNAAGYMLFMRLVPIFPFFLVNIVPALFNVRITTYIWTTFFGIIPGSFVYVNLGRQLGSIENISDVFAFETVLAFTLLGFMALLPGLYKNYKDYKRGNH